MVRLRSRSRRLISACDLGDISRRIVRKQWLKIESLLAPALKAGTVEGSLRLQTLCSGNDCLIATRWPPDHHVMIACGGRHRRPRHRACDHQGAVRGARYRFRANARALVRDRAVQTGEIETRFIQPRVAVAIHCRDASPRSHRDHALELPPRRTWRTTARKRRSSRTLCSSPTRTSTRPPPSAAR